MNVSQWVKRVTGMLDSAPLFYGHGTDNPHDEAAWLVLHAVGAPLDGSFHQWDAPVSGQQESRILRYASERIETAVPLAYVLGSAWFAGLEFVVDPAVLVPRSPIAELIDDHFGLWLDGSDKPDILDLCTGSGCIAIATAMYIPGARVVAADISSDALRVAQKNIHKHGVEAQVQLVKSNMFSALAAKSFDLIVTNPPYVASDEVRLLPKEYRAEPELGLASGTDGLDACLQIMLHSPRHLNVKGALICEVGESEQRLVELLPSVPFTWLEFSHGGSGVFALSRQELEVSSTAIAHVIEDRTYVS